MDTVEYHELAKIGIKEIFYFYDLGQKWKWDEKMIETIDGRQWEYIKEDNLYKLKILQTKLQEV